MLFIYNSIYVRAKKSGQNLAFSEGFEPTRAKPSEPKTAEKMFSEGFEPTSANPTKVGTHRLNYNATPTVLICKPIFWISIEAKPSEPRAEQNVFRGI
jgi:hypothetical protein